MPGRDIAAQVREWVADEAQNISFTDDVGWIVYPSWVTVVGTSGQQVKITHWDVEMSIPAGTVGEKIRQLVTVDISDPPEEIIREAVRTCLEVLRRHRVKTLAPQNGHGKLIIKGGG